MVNRKHNRRWQLSQSCFALVAAWNDDLITGEKSPQLLVSVYIRLISSHVSCLDSHSGSRQHDILQHGMIGQQQTHRSVFIKLGALVIV